MPTYSKMAHIKVFAVEAVGQIVLYWEPMRIYLDQAGCRLNYSEMETLARRLRAVGHQTVGDPAAAQVIVFNTCAVTTEAAAKSRQRVRQLHKQNDKARIAVTGCLATLQPGKMTELPGVELVADNTRKEMLHTLLEPWSAELDDPSDLARMQPDGNPFTDLEDTAPENANRIDLANVDLANVDLANEARRTRAFIKVQDGCNNRCTFCVVTLARGDSRSRPLGELVDEVQQLAAHGVQEAVLTGVHLGSYGRDLSGAAKSDLKELTAAILTHTDLPRLRLSSLEPWELAEGFFDLWQQWPGRLCPHLHLPLQAGSDRQLRRMARRCTVDSFGKLVADARAAIPGLIVTTDLIVGFPGETEDDFAAGMDFVEQMRFAHAHIFPFSPRAGTAAAQFGEQVMNAVKKERSRALHAVVERTGRAERLAHVATTRPVLWETRKHTLDDSSAGNHAGTGERVLWTGFTDNYLRVMVDAPAEVNLHNQITLTRLTELQGDTLVGELAAENMTVENLAR